MTQLDVMYGFAATPSEATAMALGRIREVYGVRLLTVDEAARTVRVEYDATRLTEPILDRVSLIPPQPEPVAAPAAS
jgi:hypothetical protein